MLRRRLIPAGARLGVQENLMYQAGVTACTKSVGEGVISRTYCSGSLNVWCF